MGAEPGRRSLKMPAEKLGPVIVAVVLSNKLRQPTQSISCVREAIKRIEFQKHSVTYSKTYEKLWWKLLVSRSVVAALL